MAVSDNQITVDFLCHYGMGFSVYKVKYWVGSIRWLDLYSPVKTPIPHDLAALEIWENE